MNTKIKAEDIEPGSIEEATVIAEVVYALEKKKIKSAGALKQNIYKRLDERGIDLSAIIFDYAEKNKRLTKQKIQSTQEALSRYKQPIRHNYDTSPRALTTEQHKPASDRYMPKPGTVVHRLFKAGKLSERQCQAVDIFIRIIKRANDGRQPGLIPAYADKVDISGTNKSLRGYAPNKYSEMEKRIEGLLHRHEYLILQAVKRDYYRELYNDPLTPEMIGLHLGQYKDKGQAYAYGVAVLRNLFSSLAEIFNL